METTNMKICLYSPYLPGHFGGGEKYMLDVATTLAQQGQEVFIATAPTAKSQQLEDYRKKYERFFNLSLENIRFIPAPFLNGTVIEKIKWTAQFDVMYYLTDGSLFISGARKNILHIQIPFTHSVAGLLNRIKLATWRIKNTNSYFTKSVIEKTWSTKVTVVHHPLVELPWSSSLVQQKLQKKEKYILHVGRFFRQLHSKRQDVLINIFRQLSETEPTLMKGWKLLFVGVVEDQSYADELHRMAGDLPIEFHHEMSRTELLSLYEKASLYWHATGYDVDEQRYPEKMEHFGISTVEAMSYGTVPVVIGKGGQPEILGHELKQNLWQTTDECIQITTQLMRNSHLFSQQQLQAIDRAKHFDRHHFTQVLESMIYV